MTTPPQSPIANRRSSIINLSAFTLIEMIIVIAIISTLLGLLYGAIERAQKFSRRTITYTELKTIATAFKQYKAHYNTWPTNQIPGVQFFESNDGGSTPDIGFIINAKAACLLQGVRSSRITEQFRITITDNDVYAFNYEMIPFLELSRTSPVDPFPSINPFKPNNPADPMPRAYKVLFDSNGNRQITIPADPHAPGTPNGTNIIADVAVWTVIPATRQVDDTGNTRNAGEVTFGSWDSFSVK